MKSGCDRLFTLLLTIALCFCFSARMRAAAPGAASPQDAVAAAPAPSQIVNIPGPLRSFLRMAGVSQKVTPDEVLPLVARNVEVHGFEGPQERAGRATEFLILLRRYVDQARELQHLSQPTGVIQVAGCSEAQPLLAVLGYRFRDACQKSTTLETADPERAFLTIDSGFPLPQLEERLREGKPFTYSFSGSEAPVLFTQNDWIGIAKGQEANTHDLLDLILRDRSVARLYWAMSRIDGDTQATLLQSPGLAKLLPHTAVLDFYGSRISIRGGRVLVPGGPAAEAGWKELVGPSPDSPGEFVSELLVKDDGWMATYFDTLSRVSQSRQAYFTEPHHLQRFYHALRGKTTTPTPARPVFRPFPDLLLLVTRLPLDENGQPSVPGGLDVWKDIIHRKGESKLVADWAGRAKGWNNPDQLVEGMFGLSRVGDMNGPLQLYLMLSEMDRVRAPEQRLTAETVRLLADKFSRFSDQYPIFCEFHQLNNESIARFLSTAESLDHISNFALRTNAVGMFQANVGLWQVLARQGQIPAGQLNDSWQRLIHPFADMPSSVHLFDAGRASLRELYKSATGESEISQGGLVELLAGPEQTSSEGQKMRQELADRIRAVMNGQRLASLDTLFSLADGLNQMAQGHADGSAFLPLAGELKEFELPRPLFTTSERTEWAAGVPTNRHTALQAKTDLTKILKSSGSSKEVAEARGLLSPFLRDTLVGLNYAYYEPPGAQMLHNNPLFVRSHDFSGQMTPGGGQSWETSSLFGSGLPAAGGAHLAGSLADLPFVLARAEEDFVVPENVQALIWQEVEPSLMAGAVLPRWWNVSRDELHAVTLYQRTGEELLAAAADDAKLRQTVIEILSDRMAPESSERITKALVAGRVKDVIAQVTPGETFYLAAEFRRRNAGKTDDWRVAGQELENLSHRDAAAVSWERLSVDFGVPHPALAHTNARELLDVQPFPALMDYASRLLAESWDSNNLYWARLADEAGYPPVALNRLVPELTHRMVEKIFASDFEDWEAMLRALHETGDEFREGKIASLASNGHNDEP